MIGVRVRVDDVVEAEPRLRRDPEVAVDLAQLRVDEHGAARLGAAHEIRKAAARAYFLEDHGGPRERSSCRQRGSIAVVLPRRLEASTGYGWIEQDKTVTVTLDHARGLETYHRA